jgi:hypothetical protein
MKIGFTWNDSDAEDKAVAKSRPDDNSDPEHAANSDTESSTNSDSHSVSRPRTKRNGNTLIVHRKTKILS